MKKILISVIITCFFACQSDNSDTSQNSTTTNTDSKLFELLPAEKTGVAFVNDVQETAELNYFSFMHIFMGAGMATGDLNNDGLPDLYFNSNLGANQLYKNNGNLSFEDVTQKAGTASAQGFKTGVTMADVNGDGWLDIYVCKSGWMADQNLKKNLLFINNKDFTFTEQAANYGLADISNSIQASFFDYDKDGDLDMYLVNTPVQFALTSKIMPLEQVYASNDTEKFYGSDKLYRNDGQAGFVDVTKNSGILPDIGFGLGIVTADFNEDGWTDVFVANDFFSPDLLYINQRNGTFKESRNEYFPHTSFYSMGVDAADLNQDGLTDLFVLDMLPEDYKRSRITMSMVDPHGFGKSVEWGYNYQYMHNVLHVNNGNPLGTGGSFSDHAQMAGIQKTDWSWTALMEDFDNDGLKDIFVTNGIQKDVTEQDYRGKINAYGKSKGGSVTYDEIQKFIPSQKLSNYIFKNNGDLNFTKMTEKWGLEQPSFSNGAVAADLDLDGDLDLVMNNVNEAAFVFENKSNQLNNNWLRVKLNSSKTGEKLNATITLKDEKGKILQFWEMITTRGYMSRSEEIAHFGLGDLATIPYVEINWNNHKQSILKNVKANQLLEIDANSATNKQEEDSNLKRIFADASQKLLTPVFQHTENEFDDFKNQILLPHKQSQNGPTATVADVNGDGLEDFYIGGAANQSGALYIQNSDGKFSQQNSAAFNADKNQEDLGSLFFDADGDGDQDLYVVSGGSEFPENAPEYQDRLYQNDGKGNFKKTNTLPRIVGSGSCVAAGDYDGDGDLDLFVGGRVVPEKYPYPAQSYILKNEGGRFVNATGEASSNLGNIGMVTSAIWTDFNNDNHLDLIVVGEWMNLEFFENQGNKLAKSTKKYGFDETRGWWNKIIETDIDGDGDKDYIAGNLGLNYKFKASKEKPLQVYCNDFDNNGSFDIVLAKNVEGGYVPVRGRTCSSTQMPFIKDKFPTFNDYADADLKDIYGEQNLNAALHYEAQLFESVLIENVDGKFVIKPLPKAAQVSPINGIIAHDFTKNGKSDLLIAGNNFSAEVETTKADSGIGLLLENSGNFNSIKLQKSGFLARNDVKDLQKIKLADGNIGVIVVNNNEAVQLYKTEN